MKTWATYVGEGVTDFEWFIFAESPKDPQKVVLLQHPSISRLTINATACREMADMFSAMASHLEKHRIWPKGEQP